MPAVPLLQAAGGKGAGSVSVADGAIACRTRGTAPPRCAFRAMAIASICSPVPSARAPWHCGCAMAIHAVADAYQSGRPLAQSLGFSHVYTLCTDWSSSRMLWSCGRAVCPPARSSEARCLNLLHFLHAMRGKRESSLGTLRCLQPVGYILISSRPCLAASTATVCAATVGTHAVT